VSTLEVNVPAVFEPLLAPAPYKGAYGGRGSGKSWFFAERLVIDSIVHPGLRSVCLREVQKDLKDSAKLLIEDKIQRLGVGGMFDVQRDLIATPGGGQIIFRGMQDYNAESIKSLEGFHRAWIEEAQTLSKRSLALLRPTMREDTAEIWASWNPRKKTDAIDEFLRQKPPPGAGWCRQTIRTTSFSRRGSSRSASTTSGTIRTSTRTPGSATM
jgi:phage terminase large subunit